MARCGQPNDCSADIQNLGSDFQSRDAPALSPEWSGADSHDEVHYFNGVVLTRRFSNWYDDVGYDLEIGRADGRSSVVSWRITPVKERRSSIEIAVFPHALQRVPTAVRWLPHLVRLRPQLRRYLQSVVKGLDWFITQGQPVRRNQFGAHRWFSPAVPNS